MTNVLEMPADLMRAISFADRIIDWQDNLVSEEMPPEWMWPYDELLIQWFDRIKEEREKKYGSNSGGGDTTAPMMQNEFAQGRF